MATPGSYLNGSRPPQRSIAPTDSSGPRLAIDNLIRRELKVGDPNDPYQIAQALMNRYKDDPRAQAITQEAKGLPFLLSSPTAVMAPAAPTSSDAELHQAMDDVNRDLEELTTNALLKDITPELQGWAQAVRSAMTEAAGSARFALDVRQRDKTFAIRRQLGDYARLARLVGALTPTLSLTFRRFAQSLDEVGSVLLVLMGDALANVGFSGGKFLLQAPFSELQTRRDAAIYALRNMIGATQEAYGTSDWPRGLDAYRRLFDLLEAQGQGDLRSLLVEAELARIMDELIQRAAHGRVEGLRALAVTAQLDLERFRRLAIVGQRTIAPESPPLAAFLEAIVLFADAFSPSGGSRLLRIARPPLLFYGLYGTSGSDDADRTLLDLIMLRGTLADRLDCLLQCGCDPGTVGCQILLDKILYDVDRAIDLYAVGVAEFGEPEHRAAAYAYVIDTVLDNLNPPANLTLPCNLAAQPALRVSLVETLHRVRLALRRTDVVETIPFVPELLDFANDILDALQDKLVCSSPVAPGDPVPCRDLDTAITQVQGLPAPLRAPRDLWAVTVLYGAAQRGLAQLTLTDLPEQELAELDAEPKIKEYFASPGQELCIQRDMEARWQSQVQAMVPSCLDATEAFLTLQDRLRVAAEAVGGTCVPFNVRIPPHFETSLDSIANDVTRTGDGR